MFIYGLELAVISSDAPLSLVIAPRRYTNNKLTIQEKRHFIHWPLN